MKITNLVLKDNDETKVVYKEYTFENENEMKTGFANIKKLISEKANLVFENSFVSFFQDKENSTTLELKKKTNIITLIVVE